MVQMLFSLQYQAQLRRTRPELYRFIETSIIETITESGGILVQERRCISASFDEKAIGFWLDMLTVLERILQILEDASSELYGYACLMGMDLAENGLTVVRALPSTGTGSEGTGIWCDYPVQRALSPYAVFEQDLPETKNIPLGAEYGRLKNFKAPAAVEDGKCFPFRNKIVRLLKEGSPKNAVLVGKRFIGKRDGLRCFGYSLLKGIPPLVVTFGAGGAGVGCFIDILSPEIRALITPYTENNNIEELDALEAVIFRERFRTQHSPYLLQKVRRFLQLVFDAYGRAARKQNVKPLIILENINEADFGAVQLFAFMYQKALWLVFGTCSDNADFKAPVTVLPGGAPILAGTPESTAMEVWSRVFSRVIQVSTGDHASPLAPDLSKDLWEVAYALSLFRRYFPGALFLPLFKEAGVNPRMIERAIDIFARQGIIDFKGDPQPRIPDFIAQAERILGERKKPIRRMVWTRIITWVNSQKFRPCFNLLNALTDLGGEGSDSLMLDSLIGDLVNNTYRGIEEAIENGRFAVVTGETRLPLLLYIFNTFKALSHQGEAEIRQAFRNPAPEAETIPAYKAQIFANLAGYHFGMQDIAAASEVVKEAMLLSQNQREGRGLAQAYRLFSLVNISKQRMGDAIDYFTFAIENAERAGYLDELAVTAYYAAGTHYLFGNLSRAERLARQADEAASVIGRVEWADRSRFLLGRLWFETGRYKDAQDIFISLMNQEVPGTSEVPGAAAEREATLAAWIYRSDVFLQASRPRRPANMNYDAQLFEIEAAYLTGDYRLTVSLADSLSAALPEGRFRFIEQPDWWSGFAQCELLLFHPREFLTRLLSTYRALALCRLSQFNDAVREQALDSMRQVIRDEALPQTDPNDAFYYYSHYCVLQGTGAVEVDMNTAVSMAFKRLQIRASRIDDIETKRAYQSMNHWNGALWQAAKLHKLV
ncbi:hypothetical protein FACS1894130_02660 [Spirochaetia bacterium]|nr:hypothetical protein FACS1894130_02660 [Spirochaetia bacterium]